MTNRLTAEDWIAAGFRALSDDGPQALKAEVLARRLGTTKGSFYWHFKDVATFKQDMLALWNAKAVTAIVEALAPISGPEERLRELANLAGASAPDRFGGTRAEPSIRAWALSDAVVATALAGVDAARMAYLSEQLRACGRDPAHAQLIYGAYVGLDDLAARGQDGTLEALKAVIEMVLAAPRSA